MTAKDFSLLNSKSRNAGATFEDIISSSCEYYERQNMAMIEKTPEPMRVLRSLGKGKYEAIFTKKAQPDFKGTLAGGKAIAFEAKHTDKDRIMRSAISNEQEKCLNAHEQMGAECYVFVSFGFRKFYKFPWKLFRDMKYHFGVKHIKEIDHISDFEIKFVCGRLEFL